MASKIKPIQLYAASVIALAAILMGCSQPLTKAYALRKAALTAIAKQNGYPTLWNAAIPCELGTIYERDDDGHLHKGDSDAAKFAISLQGDDDKDIVVSGTTTFHKVSGPFAAAQAGYMGLSGSLNSVHVNSVEFTEGGASANEMADIPFMSKLPSFLDKGVLEQIRIDTQQRAKNPKTYARFYVVIGSVKAKDISVNIRLSGTTTAGLSLVSSGSLASLLSIPVKNIPSIGPVNIGNGGHAEQSLTVPGESPIAALIEPLSAERNQDGTYTVYADKGPRLKAINPY